MLQRTKTPLDSPSLALELPRELTPAERERLNRAIFGPHPENTPSDITA